MAQVPGRGQVDDTIGEADRRFALISAGGLLPQSSDRRQPDQVAERLRQAGLLVRAQVLREPDDDGDFPEKTQQGFLLARTGISR